MIEEIAAVGLKHFVLLGGHAVAGFDNGLAAGDADRNGFERADGSSDAGLSGRAIEDHVGDEAETEHAEEGLAGRERDSIGGEAHAQDGESVFHDLHGAGSGIAGRAGDLKDDGRAGTGAGERGVGHALGVKIAEGGEAVFEENGAGLGVANGEEGRDILDGCMVGAADVEGFGDDGEFGRADGEDVERCGRSGRREWCARCGKGRAVGRGIGGRMSGFVDVELREESAGGEFETAERLGFEAVDGREAVEELARSARVFSALS